MRSPPHSPGPHRTDFFAPPTLPRRTNFDTDSARILHEFCPNFSDVLLILRNLHEKRGAFFRNDRKNQSAKCIFHAQHWPWAKPSELRIAIDIARRCKLTKQAANVSHSLGKGRVLCLCGQFCKLRWLLILLELFWPEGTFRQVWARHLAICSASEGSPDDHRDPAQITGPESKTTDFKNKCKTRKSHTLKRN